MKNAIIILSIVVVVLVGMCALQIKMIYGLRGQVDSQQSKLNLDLTINQNQGLVLHNVLLAACKGSEPCAQDFINKSIQPPKP